MNNHTVASDSELSSSVALPSTSSLVSLMKQKNKPQQQDDKNEDFETNTPGCTTPPGIDNGGDNNTGGDSKNASDKLTMEDEKGNIREVETATAYRALTKNTTTTAVAIDAASKAQKVQTRQKRHAMKTALPASSSSSSSSSHVGIIAKSASISLSSSSSSSSSSSPSSSTTTTNMVPNARTFTPVIAAYSSRGDWPKALALLRKMEKAKVQPSVISFDAVLLGMTESNAHKAGVQLLEDMENRNRRDLPGNFSYALSAKLMVNNNDWAGGVGVLRRMSERSFTPDRVVLSGVINVCGNARRWEIAAHIYEGLGDHPHEFATTAILKAMCFNKQWKKVLEYMEKLCSSSSSMESSREGASTALHDASSSSSSSSSPSFSLQTSNQQQILQDGGKIMMTKEQQHEDSSYSRSSNTTANEEARKIKKNKRKNKKNVAEIPNHIIFNTALDGIARHGPPSAVLRILQLMQKTSVTKSVVTYNTLLNAYATKKQWQKAEQVLESMVRAQVKADIYTYNTLLKAYRIAAEYQRALVVLDLMIGGRRIKQGGEEGGYTSYSYPRSSPFIPSSHYFAAPAQGRERTDAEIVKEEKHTTAADADGEQPVIVSFSHGQETTEELENKNYSSNRHSYQKNANGTAAGGGIGDDEVVEHSHSLMLQQQYHHIEEKLGVDRLEPDAYSYAEVIKACSDAGQHRLGLRVFDACVISSTNEEMKRITTTRHHHNHNNKDKGVKPTIVLIGAALDCCAKTGDWAKALRISHLATEASLRPTHITTTALISAYTRGRQWELALKALRHAEKAAAARGRGRRGRGGGRGRGRGKEERRSNAPMGFENRIVSRIGNCHSCRDWNS